MTDAFLTITEAVKYTGKSRRTLHRLAQHLEKTAPDQVMREKTDKGEIWRIHPQALQSAASTNQNIDHETLPTTPLPVPTLRQYEEKYLEIAQQGYGSMMTMHQEVKVIYDALLHEKDLRIQELTKALEKSQQSFWGRWFTW